MSHILAMERGKGIKRGERGFTLMEILIVIFILGLLATLVGPKLFGTLGTAKTKVAQTQLELLAGVLDRFRLDVGRYPNSAEGLQALVTSPPEAGGWAGPYLKKDLPKDPWGNDYRYASPGEHGEYDLYSLGQDNKEGGEGEEADVVSW